MLNKMLTSFHLLRSSLISFNSVSFFLLYKVSYSLVKFIPKYFGFNTIVNRIFFISFANCPLLVYGNTSLVAQSGKNPPAMQETWVQYLSWEDPLEEGMATHSSILAWRIPMDRGAWRATGHGVTKSRTRLSN